MPAGGIESRIAKVMLGIEDLPVEDRPTDAAIVAPLAGKYDLDGDKLDFVAEDGKLFVQRLRQPLRRLKYQGDLKFVASANEERDSRSRSRTERHPTIDVDLPGQSLTATRIADEEKIVGKFFFQAAFIFAWHFAPSPLISFDFWTRPPVPVYVLDDQRRILFINDACAAWAGCGAGELLGHESRYHSSADVTGPAAIAAALAPPPKLRTGERASAAVASRRGRHRRRAMC